MNKPISCWGPQKERLYSQRFEGKANDEKQQKKSTL
jgi:hypothetical protein